MLADAPPASGRLAGWILAAAAILLPPVALMTPLGVAPLLTLAAVALLIATPRCVLAGAQALWPLAALWSALALWAMASASWSILPRHSLFESGRFFLIGVEGLTVIGAALSLAPRDARTVRHAAAIGIALALALAAFELTTNAALTRLIRHYPADLYLSFSRFDRGMTTLVLAFWPALLGLGSRRLWQAALAAAVAVIVWLMSSGAAVLAVAVSGIVYFAARLWPRATAFALAAGLLGIALILPVATPSDQAVLVLHQRVPQVKASGIHRLLIWRFTADRIAERPLLGWGMDASRELPGGHTELRDELPGIGLTPDSEALPLHPHNAVLQ